MENEHNHNSDGSLTEEETSEYEPGGQCPDCGMTVGADMYWYVDRDQAPGYPFEDDEK